MGAICLTSFTNLITLKGGFPSNFQDSKDSECTGKSIPEVTLQHPMTSSFVTGHLSLSIFYIINLQSHQLSLFRYLYIKEPFSFAFSKKIFLYQPHSRNDSRLIFDFGKFFLWMKLIFTINKSKNVQLCQNQLFF